MGAIDNVFSNIFGRLNLIEEVLKREGLITDDLIEKAVIHYKQEIRKSRKKPKLEKVE